jgi:hypothetical protein
MTLPGSAWAQVSGYPTPEEYGANAAAAEQTALFQAQEPLKITLRTDIEWLRDERNDSVEVEGSVTFIDSDGSEVIKPGDVRARGNFRRDKRNCNFPPLRLDFPRRQMEGTVFEGQDKLKLVTPCNDGRDDYQRYVYDEYLAYRVHQLLTPLSFRVRLVEITYVDIEDDYDSRTKIGFLIEDEEQMAARNRATVVESPTMAPTLADGASSVVGAVFNYMVGNLDWDSARFHNVKLVRTEDGRHITVPYDFDFTGVVNARYASVNAQLTEQYGITRVRHRRYRGFCRAELQYEPVAALFGEKRHEIEDLYRSFTLHNRDDVEDALDYYQNFWKVIDDPDEFEDEIIGDCRDMGTGR